MFVPGVQTDCDGWTDPRNALYIKIYENMYAEILKHIQVVFENFEIMFEIV